MGNNNILVYRYGSICEPDVIMAFKRLGINVYEEKIEMEEKHLQPSQKMKHLIQILLEGKNNLKIDYVFSINFFPYVSEVCNKLNIIYISWTVDCPVLELFSASIKNSCNRIFAFDKAQYFRIAHYNPGKIYYLPLATNVERWDEVIESITEKDKITYGADISFIGSLYHEKSPISILEKHSLLNEYWNGYIQGISEAQLKVYGYNFLEEVIPDKLIEYLKEHYECFTTMRNTVENVERFVAANEFIGMRVSELERIRTLNEVAKEQNVTLYTRSDTSLLKNVQCKRGVTTHVQMPKIFNLSKINLNITMKSIQTGLSLRVWDILGCGGFCLSNYQSEIPEYFQIGKDLDCYESIEECKEKVAFYLAHDDIRKEIANNGYQKVKTSHTYEKRIIAMFQHMEETA